MSVSVPVELPGISRAGSEQKDITRLIVATSIGNALEWYDIAVYGYFAVYISKAFFPSNDPTTSLLLTFGTFGLSFLIRPIGGVVLGAYADRYGRKASLMVSIVLMTVGTLALALTPAYETIGILAPIAVLTARLVQGFSAGGEFGSSTAFLVEHAPDRRGFIASWQFASQGLSGLLASAFGIGLTAWMAPAEMQAWGWRIPFLFGVLVGPVGIYIRNHLEDATAPPAAKQDSPVRQVFLHQKLRVILSIGALAISTAINYLIVYMPTYAVKTLNLPPTVGFAATFAAGIALTFLTPIAGMMSDKVGRTTHMIAVNLLLLFSIYPTFLLLTRNPTPTVIVVAVLWLATLKSLYYGPLAALMSELFPAATRGTGLGLGYNIGVTLFGGMGPVIMRRAII
jgi:MHS family proline/betaine transporter-like MFS transporter